MTDNLLTLFCLVDGEATSNAFPVSASTTTTVGELKDLIKAKKAIDFQDVDADKLTLSRVNIPIIDDDDETPIALDHVNKSDKKKLGPATRLSKVFPEELPEETVHIIIQRPPPQVHAPVPIRASTPLPGYLSDDSRPGTPLSGDLHVDIKKITDKFFAPGPIANFLDAFVKGEKALPTTSGSIRGLPRAWRRGFGKGPSSLRRFVFYLDTKVLIDPDEDG
ncbi:hypothetical protein BGZ70_000791 [Mortierella alpina]|uniref:Crinkler effector protein N-terminal domain-containing protein n=1 Tax=Mortierella alpina TaxID=64518 RepID=A0A9P6IX77_MORAP|nr:hypothetical protein BGZ70_000791 [Mortierella alpina]